MANIICGVDVSSETLDCRIGGTTLEARVRRDPEGIAALGRFCVEHGVALVVMEATGGYEKLPFGLLWEAGVPCAIANARSVRRFAEAMGVLEKTDRIDAGIIADYARAKGLTAQAPEGPAQQRLRALVTRLRQLTELKVAQANQRRLVLEPTVLAIIDEMLALIARQSRALEVQIAELLSQDPLWRALDAAFREIKGVAGRTVARLMAEMPEIGTVSNKAVAKLAGLAPIASDSGKRQGRRSVRGGRAQVRSILVVVAGVVARHDPDLAAFHQRLIQAGKPRMSVRIAVARKLLVRLNAKARDARALLLAA
ncbi:IS110 family RNA-guided transposase [Caulobacter hibisci]|uniref:IS110 family transposase n=1 Tax=Caulobacter hibisci TaxID=2035993 RepID=A0ABS0SSZ4_9CAUL|nr:IS110 family transposase [Caulobacter hibisci]